MRSVLDDPLISRSYFFPRRDSPPEPFEVEVDGAVLSCHYERPHADAPTLIHFHGNGEVVSDYFGSYLRAMTALGVNCLLAEYRGYGGSTGTPQLAGMLGDVAKVIEASGTSPERVVLFGRSVGSIYAIHGVSVMPKVAGLIIESGIADVKERLLLRVRPSHLQGGEKALDAAVAEHLDHRNKLSRYEGPVLIMHTREDGLVDLSHAQRNHDWIAGSKQLEIFEDGDHNSIIMLNMQRYFEVIRSFLTRHHII